VIFTEDNATAYEVSQRFLIPCLTHQTVIKERQAILDRLQGQRLHRHCHQQRPQ
jgi:superfamily II DNA or RNA helicase